MGTTYYPAAGFCFGVGVGGEAGDGRFSAVTGIGAELEIEESGEGIAFRHRLRGHKKAPPLVLKRGKVSPDSPLARWISETLGSGAASPIHTQTVDLKLVDGAGKALMQWSFYEAYPVKWEADDLKASPNEIAIEALELAYSYFVRTMPGR